VEGILRAELQIYNINDAQKLLLIKSIDVDARHAPVLKQRFTFHGQSASQVQPLTMAIQFQLNSSFT